MNSVFIRNKVNNQKEMVSEGCFIEFVFFLWGDYMGIKGLKEVG